MGGGKLEVVVITLYYFPRQGGATTRINSFIKGNEDVSFTVFAPSYGKGEWFLTPDYRDDLPENAVIERLPLYAKRGFAALSFLASCAVRRGRFKRSGFDVLHCISPPITNAIAGAIVAGSWRRVLVDVGDPWVSGLYVGGFIKSGFIGRVLSALERWALAKARYVIYRSPLIEDCLAGASTSCEVILTAPLPVNEEKWEPPASKRLVYTGHMGPLYDLETLVVSMKGVAEVLSDVHLELIGDGPTRPCLEALVRENSLAERVTFSGTLTPDEVRSRRRKSSISFVPINNSPEIQYAMSVKLFESLSQGVPVIGWGVEGARRLIEDSGGGVFISDPRPEIVSKVVVELLGDPGRLANYSKNAIAFSREHLDRDKAQARINQIYQAIREGGS